jgi:hypothetical protein
MGIWRCSGDGVFIPSERILLPFVELTPNEILTPIPQEFNSIRRINSI